MKTYNVYGVEMTSLEEMRFSKYLDNKRIAMNTFYKEERKKIAEDWLNEYKKFHCVTCGSKNICESCKKINL